MTRLHVTADRELAARRAAVAQANAHQATCPHCGHLLPGGTPAQDAEAPEDGDPPPSGYMSRSRLL